MSKSMFRRGFLAGAAGFGAVPAALGAQTDAQALPGIYPVTKFGAVADGVRMDTQAIHAAIEACARGGGGTVYFPPGRYLSGTVFLKSNVSLYLEAGAVLLGSKDLQDYPSTAPDFRSYTDNYTEKSLIYAERLENISILGQGVIDGQGAFFPGPYKVRPYMLRIIQCRSVAIEGVTLKDSPMWVLHLLACDEVNVHGIRIHARVNRNNDGIDLDCCDKVAISNCEIWSGDDAIVLKSTADRPCRNVTISNCVLSSYCNALKMGTESNGGFQNISISNCSIYETRLSGIALEIVDGGVMDHVNVSGITMQKIGAPIFVRLGNRARPFLDGGPAPGMGRMRNILISNVQAEEAQRVGCAISGIPGHPIENLAIDNVRLSFVGGGTREDARREIPEFPEKYPEHSMFGTLPAYGLFCRHVRNMSLRNVVLGFAERDERPAVACDDVEGLDMSATEFAGLPGGEPAVRLHNVSDAFLHANRVRTGRAAYLHVSGARTSRIRLAANDLERAKEAVTTAPDVPAGEVKVL